MMREIFRFELRQQLKSPLYWLIALAFAAIAFAAASSDSVVIGGGIGNVNRNAPSVVIWWLAAFSLFSMFVVTLFVAGAALRDFEHGTSELIFTTPISRAAYLGGRFGAGYIASAGIMVAIALGLVLGALMPWVDPARVGPTRIDTFVYAFGVVVLPNLLFISALLFGLASLTRSMLKTYIGVIAFFVLWQVAMVASRALEHRELAALIDPVAVRALDLITRYWTAEERNLRLPGLSGALLANRAIWISAAFAMLGATFALFRTERGGTRSGKKAGIGAIDARNEAPAPTAVVARKAAARAGFSARLVQWRRLAAFDARFVFGGSAFLVMLFFALANLAGAFYFGNQQYGTPVYPVTHLMLETVEGAYNWLLIIIIGFYAGELVWRERANKLAAVTDAFPLPDAIPLAAKLSALFAVIASFLAIGMVACVIAQWIQGGVSIEPKLYFSWFALQFAEFALFAVLAVFVQAIANGKFLGYLFVLIYLVSVIALPQLGFEHSIYNYGSAPEAPYSDMNGYGHFLAAHLWFTGYWGLLATAMLVLAALYWARGTTEGIRARTSIARERFRWPQRIVLALALTGFIATGAFLWHQTTVVNTWLSKDDIKARSADYEKTYRPFRDQAQPRITDVRVEMDMFPSDRHVAVRGHYMIRNTSDAPIGELHVRVPIEVATESIDLAAHEVVKDDRVHGVTIYRLAEPLAPGASMPFDFALDYQSVGLRNTPGDTHVVENGTFINNDMLPRFGYDEGRQLADRNDRRKYKLPELPRMPKIDDARAQRFNMLSPDADWVNFEAILSTEADQIAVAPGYLEREWMEGGRRHFHYRMDTPITNFFSFQSARYAVARDSWNGVAIEVFHDPKHAWNVPRMIDSAKKSLAHFSAAYGPYQFRQLRILEFPRYASFAQSFANTVPYSESIGFIADLRKKDDIDYVFYVTAHEVAHQWWGHQLLPANVQGATMLVETFAQYSSLMVQEAEYGKAQMRKFLQHELDSYLAGRGGEVAEELPLARNENQPYIHYRKGAVVMYALKEALGKDTVDGVLARYLEKVRFQMPPYTTTRDFLAELRASAGPRFASLIDDSFERITVFDNRVTEARARRRADGRYDVTLAYRTGKIHADGVGRETPATLDQPIEIGVFARATEADGDGAPIYLARHVLDDGAGEITVTVDGEPYEAGVDPYNKLIDRVSSDNRKRVTLE